MKTRTFSVPNERASSLVYLAPSSNASKSVTVAHSAEAPLVIELSSVAQAHSYYYMTGKSKVDDNNTYGNSGYDYWYDILKDMLIISTSDSKGVIINGSSYVSVAWLLLWRPHILFFRNYPTLILDY